MADEVKVALIGLDTSHTVEFARRMQAPDCPPDQKVEGLRAIACLRFETPFQNKEGLDKRQQTLEGWGVKVTESFAEAVKGCDAVMLEINDPAFHLQYVRKAVRLRKPMFIDKPLAATVKEGQKILALLKKYDVRAISCSSLRFAQELENALQAMPRPTVGTFNGAYGKAPSGDSLVWYGVHVFDMLQRAMGRGALSVRATESAAGVVAVVEYPENREAVAEVRPLYHYCGQVMSAERPIQFICDANKLYTNQLKKILAFFQGGEPPVAMEDALEVLALMTAARKSISRKGKPISLQ